MAHRIPPFDPEDDVFIRFKRIIDDAGSYLTDEQAEQAWSYLWNNEPILA